MTATPQPPLWNELPNAPPVGTVLAVLHELSDGQATMRSVEFAGHLSPSTPFRVLLLRSGTDVRAYANRCAHFGVPLAATQAQLIYSPHASITCNVHYARYRWEDGVCESGECEGESLISIPVQVTSAGTVCISA
jgi:nitrite reductase/ring-hydroxylating ferredoxin subunit